MVNQVCKVVLISESGYSSKHDALLLSFLDQGVELFSVVGRDCELWEEAMDDLVVGGLESTRYITTTSHPGENVDDVMEFATAFNTKTSGAVHVVNI